MLPRKATFALKSLVSPYEKEVLVKKENLYQKVFVYDRSLINV